MFLIDDDQTRPSQRGEYGGASADDHWSFPLIRGDPGLQALAVAEP